VLNIASMATLVYQEPEVLMDLQEYLNLAFSGIFFIEAALKIIGETSNPSPASPCGLGTNQPCERGAHGVGIMRARAQGWMI
jgi:hypothetical protein